MAKKIWISMHLRNFGPDKIGPCVRTPFMLADVKCLTY